MSNHNKEIIQLLGVANIFDKVLKIYNKYLPCDNMLDNYLIENLGYILPINKNYYLEFSGLNKTALGGNVWLCYDNTRIINVKNGASGILHAIASGLTLGFKKSNISFCTNDANITSKEFTKKLVQEIKDSLPILEKTLKDNSFKISQLHDELKRKNIRVKQKELYNNPELLEKCRKNRELIGLDF